ncbi:MAG: adenosylcobinamide-GDP ribazoletransferase [Eubacteriales bacterium]
MRYITAFFMAWGNFFYIPCPVKLWDDNLRRLQLVFFPIIGALIGLLWYALFAIFAKVGVPEAVAVFVFAMYPYKISGFIHLDGFMDCSDAILSRRNLDERQRILKDSHVGAFAVINVGILFVASYAAMSGIVSKFYEHEFVSIFDLVPLVLIPVMSRAYSALAVLEYRSIATSQYAKSFEAQISYKYRLFINAFWMIPLVVITWLKPDLFKVMISVCTVLIVHWAVTAYAREQLGGMNGDIAGYALTISECAGLIAWNFVI